MNSVSYMDILNHTPHIQAIMQKLPVSLQSKWRVKVLSIREHSQRHVNFSDLVQFFEHAAEASNYPVYSKEDLRVEDIATTIKLETMRGQSTERSFIIKDLTVCDLKGSKQIQLASCF